MEGTGEAVQRDTADWQAEVLDEDPALAAALDDARCRGDLLLHLIQARHGTSRSQAVVAKLMETTQSAVSDLEGGATDPRLSTLQRYARAVGQALHVHCEPQLGYIRMGALVQIMARDHVGSVGAMHYEAIVRPAAEELGLAAANPLVSR